MTSLTSLPLKKLIFVTGKGGVGKSTVSAILAKNLSDRGKKVLIVENAACAQIPPIFGKKTLGHEFLQLTELISTINLDARDCLREYFSKYLKKAIIYNVFIDNHLAKSFLNAIPGLDEVLILGRIYFECSEEKERNFDHVIVDCHAFGHFHNLISTPQTIIDAELSGPFLNEIVKVNNLLRNRSNSGVIVVLCPEALVATETIEFSQKLLRRKDPQILGMILNRSWSQYSHQESRMEGFDKVYFESQIKAGRDILNSLINAVPEISDFVEIPDYGWLDGPIQDRDFSKL